jgi:hypothetical protein
MLLPQKYCAVSLILVHWLWFFLLSCRYNILSSLSLWPLCTFFFRMTSSQTDAMSHRSLGYRYVYTLKLYCGISIVVACLTVRKLRRETFSFELLFLVSYEYHLPVILFDFVWFYLIFFLSLLPFLTPPNGEFLFFFSSLFSLLSIHHDL